MGVRDQWSRKDINDVRRRESMRKTGLLVVVMLLVAGMAVMAQGQKAASGTSGKTVLTAYMQIDPASSQYEGHNEIMRTFAEKYPDIEIQVEYANGEAFHQKFQAMAASRQMPDIFTTYGGARSAYITDTGLVMDISEYLTDDFKSRFSSATWAAQGKNGEFWMIPPALSVCHSIYVNTDILKELGLSIPKSYEEWKAQIPVIRAAGYYVASMGNKDPWVVNSWLLSLFVDRYGGPEWFEKAARGDASFTEAPFVSSLALIKDMTDSGMFSPGVNQMSNTEADQEFYQKKSVYLIDAGWRTSAMDRDLPAAQLNAIEMIVFPALRGEVRSGTSTATSSEGFGIAKSLQGTAKADAAWTFISFYAGEEGAAIRSKHGEVTTYLVDTSKIDMGIMQKKYAEFQGEYPMGYVFDAVMNNEGVTLLNTDIQEMMLGRGKSPERIAADYERWVAANDTNRD